MTRLTRADCLDLDQSDPLASRRDAFVLPEGVIYLDGHSLGPMPKAALDRLHQVASVEWARDLIGSWNSAGWFQAPYRLGARLAPLIGAAGDEVVVTDTTAINLFKVSAAALALRPERRVVVMDGSDFPTDTYVIQGLTALMDRGYQIRFAEHPRIAEALDETVAATILNQAHYRTAQLLDMAAITGRAHAVGALAVWDLCHSAGVAPVDLNGAGADFAVGCTYKYLNGGPGSPAFIFAARRHHGHAAQPLTGWWGHAEPFAFDRDYRPAPGIGQMLTGTQPILSLAALEAGLDLAAEVDIGQARAKCLSLGDLLIRLIDERCPDAGFTLISPREAAQRGGHVAFDHADGYPIMRALIDRGVVGDFRAPQTLRFGLAPLYVRHVDIWDAVEILTDVLRDETWRAPRFSQRDAVT